MKSWFSIQISSGIEITNIYVFQLYQSYWFKAKPSNLIFSSCHNPNFDHFILILFTENDKKKKMNDEKIIMMMKKQVKMK